MSRFILAAVLVFWATAASGVSIGVFADSAGTECSFAIPYPGNTVYAFVVASFEGLAPDGVTGGAFRINGMPEGWTVEVVSTPGAVQSVGDVFGSGVWILYSTCVVESQVLMKLAIAPTSAVHDVAISVEANQEDTDTCFLSTCGPCPRFCGCNGLPACYCAAGSTSRINGACAVAVGHKPWSFMKSVYR